MLDEQGNSVEGMKESKSEEAQKYNEKLLDVTKRSRMYLQRSSDVRRVIKNRLIKEEEKRKVKSSDHYLDRETFAYMSYFMSPMTEDLKQGKAFDEKEWEKRIDEVFKDKDLSENMVFNRDSISSEDYKKFEEQKFESTESEETLANALKDKSNASKDKKKEYEELDEDQKKLFALALQLMDIGSIGYGTSGTTELLNAKSKKAQNLEKIQKALDGYVSGEGLNVDVNYKEAFNKLFSNKDPEPEPEPEETEEKKEEAKKKEGESGEDASGGENAQKEETKKKEGESGENAQAEETKKKEEQKEENKQGENAEQKEEQKKTEGAESEEETEEKKEEVKYDYVMSETAFEKAMQFAKEITAKKLAFGEKDWERLNDGYSSINTAGVKYKKEKQLEEVDSLRGQFLTLENVREKMLEYVKKDDKAIIHNLSGIRERFEKMTQDDLKLFTRIMQDRSVLDISAADDGSGEELYVDHEKRNALREALSADLETRTAVMSGFDDPESCFQVLVNALSFQIRDDINSSGKDLTKDNFKEGALDRKTLADWDLIERAFDLLDEVKEKRTAVYALSHATNYIDQSGNLEAREENRKLKEKYTKKEDFTEQNFEDYIKEQAKKDGDEDIRRVVAGYHSLTDKEKNLFFKVLARRDLLDISKKNYKSSFFGRGERNYVNQAERDKLIDKYIASSLENNVGITLDEGAHFDAMQSLFTTQIDDSEKLSTDKSIEDLMAAERNLFMLRSTAIDWKLFKRALNFVNRATEELEYAEGNAQLYRGAGNLVDNGKLDMNYSFLRKNFHRTGNQWSRYLGKLGARKLQEVTKADDVLKYLTMGVTYADKAASFIGLRKSGGLRKGLGWLSKKGSDAKQFLDAKDKEPEIKLNMLEIKEKEPTKEEIEAAEQEEKERRENLNYYGHVKDGIDNFFSQANEATDAVAETVDFVREELSGVLASHFESMEGLTYTKEIKAKADQNNIVEKTINKGKAPEEEPEEETPKFAGPKATDVMKMIQKTAETTVYSFLNDNFIKGEVKEDGDQLEQLKENAAKYSGEEFEKSVKEMVGEENAQKILDLENGYYEIKEQIGSYITKTVNYINYAKKCVKHVENIAMSAQNINLLKDGEKSAKSRREEDDEKLKKAGEKRLDADQSKKVKNIVDKHRGMTEMSKELGVRLEEFNIAGEVVNFAMETASMAGGKLNVGQEAIAKAIHEGMQFALFALRIASDRNVLAQYFLKTDAGKAVVDKVRKGFEKSGDNELITKLDKSIKLQEKTGQGNFIDILSDARAYEHTSELVENTAMSMAQSIVFSASNYNPMAETRLMAITVMSVMGLQNEIGSVEPSTVEKLFNKFNMSR